MTVPFLDCRSEACELREPPADRRAWLAAEITDDDWKVTVDKRLLDELIQLADYIAANPLQNLQRRISDFDLPCSTAVMRRMRERVDDNVGFAVLDRLPMDDYPMETMLEVYWLLGQFMGRPVAQKWNGEMIYNVHDSGEAFSYGVRGSRTAVELNFHVDNAFAKMVPDYVGLLCRHPAVEGGVSRFCSLYTVHQRMLENYPTELHRLYQPMYFDRQKEHAENAPPVCLAPYFSWNGDRLNARANASLVRQGYKVVGETIDTALVEALAAVDEVCTSEDIWFEASLERGQIQYLNNHEVGHYRSEFVDHTDPDKKRHLYRLWHRERGSACYDGERLI